MHVTDLQRVLTELHQTLDEEIFRLSQQLHNSLATCGKVDCTITQVGQNAAKVFPTAVDQNPT